MPLSPYLNYKRSSLVSREWSVNNGRLRVEAVALNGVTVCGY